MKKRLKTEATLYHIVDGKEILGFNSKLSGSCSRLSGDCSKLSGDCSHLSGDCTHLEGNCLDIKHDRLESSGNPKIVKKYIVGGKQGIAPIEVEADGLSVEDGCLVFFNFAKREERGIDGIIPIQAIREGVWRVVTLKEDGAAEQTSLT